MFPFYVTCSCVCGIEYAPVCGIRYSPVCIEGTRYSPVYIEGIRCAPVWHSVWWHEICPLLPLPLSLLALTCCMPKACRLLVSYSSLQ